LRSCVHICGSNHCEYCELLHQVSGEGIASESRLLPESDLYAGYDPGGMRDPAALVVVEKCKEAAGFRVVKTMTYLAPPTTSSTGEETRGVNNNPYTKFTLQISDLHKSLHFKKVLVDSTGLGAPIVELCKELGLPTSEMKFTSGTKEEILFNLKVLLEKRQIFLPPNDNALLSSLNCIEAERTRSGGYSFNHSNGTHDDLAYALALAVWVAGRGNGKVIIMKQDDGCSWREDSASFGRPASNY